MNKSIGIFAAITASVVLLSGVMAQPPAGGAGKGGGGGFGKGPLSSKEAFFTKYDTNSDKKVTKDEYMKVSTKDAEEQWDKIAGAGGKDVDEAKIEKYIADNPAPGFGAGGFGGKMGGGKMGGGKKGGAGAPGAPGA